MSAGDGKTRKTVKYRPMKPDRWTPRVTVAAIVERDGRFLVIEEQTSDGLRINQPAGHLEAGETLVDAVKRPVPVGVGADLADRAPLDAGERALRRAAPAGNDERVPRRQDGNEGAADKAGRAGDQHSAHATII